ncbi:hypothetical protein B0H10DRAFT_2000980 [Mycena sp. CBHHK59/15]|nr:hypothetical protein B0H10DRAFT_2000980 [Mycena sp. CBHHK59/15]
MPCRSFTCAVPAVLARKTHRTIGRSRHYSSPLPKLKQAAPNSAALELLQATIAYLPQALSENSPQLKLWNGVLSSAVMDLSSTDPRPTRLVVWGTDTAGARDLVTAILEEPFNSDLQQARALRERWDPAPSGQTSMTIEYGNTAADGSSSIRLPLPYLDQFPVALQITEASHAADPAIFHTADVAVFVSRLDELQRLSVTRTDSLVVLNVDSPESQPCASSSRTLAAPRKYFFVNPSQALAALKALRENPSSPEAVKRYQTISLESRITTLTESLNSILSSIESTSDLRNRTALAHIRNAHAACCAAIRDTRPELDAISAGVSDLQGRVEEERVKVHRAVFGPPDDDAVEKALNSAESIMEYKMRHMTWKRMVWQIDEISTYIATTLQRVYCRDLEKELIYHAGCLAGMQRALTESTFKLVSTSSGALRSSVLHNTLSQLSAVPTFQVAPDALAAPINARCAQILQYPTAQLHVAAQRAMFRTGGMLFTGAGISWASWADWLVGTGEGVFGPGSALATGILVALVGVHWGQSVWNKARKRWWEDWERVGGGLRQDLSENLVRTMENNVLVVAQTGCSELSTLVQKRKTELERLQDDLDRLSTAVDQLEQRK